MRATGLSLAIALAILLLLGCAPQAIPYIVSPHGRGGVWIMPKGAAAPVNGYLLDPNSAAWLLDRAGIGAQTVPQTPQDRL